MPQLGETVAEGKITKWFKAAGDAVKPGDNLFEIETDKTSMEVPATSAGTLTDIHFQRRRGGESRRRGGGDCRCGATVHTTAAAAVREAHTNKLLSSAPPRKRGPGSSAEARPRTGSPLARGRTDGKRLARLSHMDPFHEVRTPERNFGPAKLASGTVVTPLARRLAGERGIDLSRISGSGPHGRIVARDVEVCGAAAAPAQAAGASAAQVKALYEGIAYEEVPLDSMRRTIATRLVEAKQTIPHFYLTADLDVGRLIAMREEANAAAPKSKDGQPAFKLSLNDFIIKAWAAALQRIPAANAVWAGDRILRFRSSDIGVAVALDGGLITPVIRNVETKSLTAISAEMRDLAERARAKKLQAERISGRRKRHLQSRHVRRARILGHHQSAARHHSGGRRYAPRAGRGGGRQRQVHQPDDRHIVVRPSRGGRRARRRTACGFQETLSKSRSPR